MKNESYNLKRSSEQLGPVVPIILAADGKRVIDGTNRRRVNKDWPTYVDKAAKSPLDIAIRRLVANGQRRNLPAWEKTNELDTIVTELTKDHKLEGEGLARELVRVTGFSLRWVYKYLPDKWKGKQGRPKASKIAQHAISYSDTKLPDWHGVIGSLKERCEATEGGVKLSPDEVDAVLILTGKYLETFPK